MSKTEAPGEPQFGAYRLSAGREALRRFGDLLPRYWMSALARHVSLAGVTDPIDVELFRGQRVRLHPSDNRCERRAVCGVRSWDAVERQALRDAIERQALEAAVEAAGPAGFHFVDAGANVGLYTLWARDVARSAGVAFRGLAVEPDPINRARLAFNLAASEALDVEIAPVALAAEAGAIRLLSEGLANRGEAQIAASAALGDVEVPARPLIDVVGDAGFQRIDAMKMDIEGHEARVLAPFLAAAPPPLWPRFLIVETGKAGAAPPLLKLLQGRGFTVARRLEMNTILTAPEPA